MYDSGPAEPPADVQVEPEQLDQQASRFQELGAKLRKNAGDQPRPARLGTAPPAKWFAQRLAALAGPDGAAGMMLSWADGLDGVGENQRTTARRYREADGRAAAAMNKTGRSGQAR